MRLFFLILSFLLASIGTHGQSEIDSLYTIWKDEALADSLRSSAYHIYIRKGFLYSNPDSARQMADELIDFGKRKDYPMAVADGLNIKATVAGVDGNYQLALDYSKQSMMFFREASDPIGESAVLLNIGNFYRKQGDYVSALDHFSRALKLKREVGHHLGEANSLRFIGNVYLAMKDYSRALDYYKRSQPILERQGSERHLANLNRSMGNMYEAQGEYGLAMDHHSRALGIYESLNHRSGIAASVENIGKIYQDQGNLTAATENYRKSLRIYEEVGNQSGSAKGLSNLGMIQHLQGDNQQAVAFCQKGYTLSASIGNPGVELDACRCLYQAYKAINRSKDALVYLEKIRTLEDGLKDEETVQRLQQMEFQKAMLQDSIQRVEEARLIQLEHEEGLRKEQNKRNILAGVGVLFLILAGSFYSRWRYVRKASSIIEKERDRSENLLLNILPREVAQELKEKGSSDARNFEMVSILFSDFKGFTELSSRLSAGELVSEISHCFKGFDLIMEEYGIEKIKTIGDSYMAAGGIPVSTPDSTKNTVLAALQMQSFIQNRKAANDAVGKLAFEMRLGIHTGPVVAGIVGIKKFQFDIWGDTVNTANRMESNGAVGMVNISRTTYELIKDDPQFKFENRGKIDAKGKGEMEMYFVSMA